MLEKEKTNEEEDTSAESIAAQCDLIESGLDQPNVTTNDEDTSFTFNKMIEKQAREEKEQNEREKKVRGE